MDSDRAASLQPANISKPLGKELFMSAFKVIELWGQLRVRSKPLGSGISKRLFFKVHAIVTQWAEARVQERDELLHILLL